VDAAANNNASRMLERDVENLANYFGQFAPELQTTQYGKEIWALYQCGDLFPDTLLTGRFQQSEKPADVRSVMREIDSARDNHAAKLRYQQLKREEGR
jgi:RIO kinase 1